MAGAQQPTVELKTNNTSTEPFLSTCDILRTHCDSIGEATGSESLKNLPEVTRPVSGRARIPTDVCLTPGYTLNVDSFSSLV